MDQPSPQPRKMRSACDKCHLQKLRCVRKSGQSRCERCERLDAVCRFAPRARRGSKKTRGQQEPAPVTTPHIVSNELATPSTTLGPSSNLQWPMPDGSWLDTLGLLGDTDDLIVNAPHLHDACDGTVPYFLTGPVLEDISPDLSLQAASRLPPPLSTTRTHELANLSIALYELNQKLPLAVDESVSTNSAAVTNKGFSRQDLPFVFDDLFTLTNQFTDLVQHRLISAESEDEPTVLMVGSCHSRLIAIYADIFSLIRLCIRHSSGPPRPRPDGAIILPKIQMGPLSYAPLRVDFETPLSMEKAFMYISMVAVFSAHLWGQLADVCDGAKPCANCHKLSTLCEYSGTDGRKKESWKSRIEALEQRNAYLEQRLQEMGSKKLVEAVQEAPPFVDQSLPAAPELDEQGVGVQETPQGESSTSADALNDSSRNQPAVSVPSDEIELQHMFYVATATHPLLRSLGPTHGYHHSNRREKLPGKDITRQALGAFFQCASALFYVTTVEKSTELLDRVYDSGDVSVQDICELCSIAAIGSQYKLDEIPAGARAVYFYLASTSLDEAIAADPIQRMRIYICLCMACVMDKSSSARLLLISALDLARGKMEADLQRRGPTDSEQDKYWRTLQTLVFLEGWLSYSLGYRNCLTKSHIDLVHYTIPLRHSTENGSALTTRLIQSHMTKLTLLAAGIQDETSSYGSNYDSHADTLSTRLDSWYESLPPDLHLEALAMSNPIARRKSNLQERAVNLMHLLHIDMRLQLYCQRLKARYVAGVESDEESLQTLFAQIPKPTADAHLEYAVQLAKIASHMYEQRAIVTRCWIAIRAVFDACIIFFLTACQRYISKDTANPLPDLRPHVNTCLTVLTFCSTRDLAATRLCGMLDPVFQEFSRLASTSSSNSSSNSGSGEGSSSDPGYGTGPRVGSGSVSGSERGRAARGHGESNDDEMRIQYILDDGPPALVRMTRQLLDLMSPGGNVWV
ncbi:hypothetical protein BJX64DRAFT_291162 [Aspergillus heterothallicus]